MKPMRECHVVALPYPGRGHINPMLNICKQLSMKKPDTLISFVVTEEWLGLLGSDPKPEYNIVFATLPNAIPSEHGRAKDFPGFVEAVNRKLEALFEELLDRLEPAPSVIVADSLIGWVTGVGNRRNIPVASFWTMPATVFTVFRHFELLKRNGHFPANLSERGQEVVNYIPGISTTCLVDFPTIFYGDGLKVLSIVLECVANVSKAQYLLFTSVHDLEPEVFKAIKPEFPFPIYPIGPSIPHFLLETSPQIVTNDIVVPDYIQWLDSQPKGSVLYVSLGSFLSVSRAQMDEIVRGVRDSRVRYFWVARGDMSRFNDDCCCDIKNNGDNDNGILVPWCDQLRVLCHSSIGGFLTHCGWNSTLESVFSGVPMLTFPIFWDQIPNSKRIVEDWKVGIRVRKEVLGNDCEEVLVSRDEIAEIVKRFMDLDNDDGVLMRNRVKNFQDVCRRAIGHGGSSDTNLDAFIRDISQGYHG